MAEMTGSPRRSSYDIMNGCRGGRPLDRVDAASTAKGVGRFPFHRAPGRAGPVPVVGVGISSSAFLFANSIAACSFWYVAL